MLTLECSRAKAAVIVRVVSLVLQNQRQYLRSRSPGLSYDAIAIMLTVGPVAAPDAAAETGGAIAKRRLPTTAQ